MWLTDQPICQPTIQPAHQPSHWITDHPNNNASLLKILFYSNDYCPRSSSSQSAELCLDNLLAKLAASCSEHYSWDFLFLCICDIPAWLLLPSSGQKILILMLHPSCLNFSFISWLYCPTKRFVLCTCVINLQHGEIYSRLELKAISGSPLIFPNLLTLSLACLCFFFFLQNFQSVFQKWIKYLFQGQLKTMFTGVVLLLLRETENCLFEVKCRLLHLKVCK